MPEEKMSERPNPEERKARPGELEELIRLTKEKKSQDTKPGLAVPPLHEGNPPEQPAKLKVIENLSIEDARHVYDALDAKEKITDEELEAKRLLNLRIEKLRKESVIPKPKTEKNKKEQQEYHYENELERRMNEAGINTDIIEDERLVNFITRVGRLNPTLKTADNLTKNLDFLNNYQMRADLNPDMKRFDDAELAAVLGPLTNWIEELDKKQGTESHSSKSPSKEKESIQTVRIEENTQKPEDESVEGWTKFIFARIDEVETETTDLRSPDAVDTMWKKIENSIKTIPNKTGDRYVPTGTSEGEIRARQYFEATYHEGVFLKERLQTYYEARKSLHIRYLQIRAANGNLASMGLSSQELGHLNIGKDLQELRPVDEWSIIHADEMFTKDIKTTPNKERKELLPDVDAALSLWHEVGVAYDKLPDKLLTRPEMDVVTRLAEKDKDGKIKWPSSKDASKKVSPGGITANQLQVYRAIPTYKSTLNSSSGPAIIRERIAQNLESHTAATLADRLFTCWLTFPSFDRDLENKQGDHEAEDLMYFDAKRGIEFATRVKSKGPGWTVKRFFARPNQEEIITEEKAQTNPELAHRKDELKFSRQQERRVILDDGLHRGEFIGDFLQTTTIETFFKDEPVKRKLSSFAIDRKGNPIPGGWKKIPFFMLGENSHSGFFTGTIKTVKTIEDSLLTEAKPEELVDRAWWINRKSLLNALRGTSPWFNSEWEALNDGTSLETYNKYRDERLDKICATDAAGLFWFGSLDAQRGVEGARGKSKYTTPFMKKVKNAFDASRYVVFDMYYNQLVDDISEMGYGAEFWRKLPFLKSAARIRKDFEK